MIRVNQIKLPINSEADYEINIELLTSLAAGKLRIPKEKIRKISIYKRSVDARKKPDLFCLFGIDVLLTDPSGKYSEKEILKRFNKDNNVLQVKEERFEFAKTEECNSENKRPVIVGFGPAGIFCAYYLARAGYKPIVIERGEDVDSRTAKVNEYWEGKALDTESNVQFGEGGAGTFSDGKLNTVVKDPGGRNRAVLETLIKYGANESILYDAKPHVGTDVLHKVVKNIRNEIISLGGSVIFNAKLTDVICENNQIKAVDYLYNGKTVTQETDKLVLAIGHSARDTFEMLYNKGISMECKDFATGFRVIHPQEIISKSQYGDNYKLLPPASYKLTAQSSSGHGVYSFCMCPGGYVVNASSEDGRICVNGMSYSDRAGKYANSAIVVTVSKEDYKKELEKDSDLKQYKDHPLAGMFYQRLIEKRSYELGKGSIPVSQYGNYKSLVQNKGQCSEEKNIDLEAFEGIRGKAVYADITSIFSKELNESFIDGMESFANKIKGFNAPDTVLCGVEARTSSPVRILRDKELLTSIKVNGLYPCGEGAGYAGGITSAAIDGLRIAEKIVRG